jgi:hypothetical protein
MHTTKMPENTTCNVGVVEHFKGKILNLFFSDSVCRVPGIAGSGKGRFAFGSLLWKRRECSLNSSILCQICQQTWMSLYIQKSSIASKFNTFSDSGQE